LGRTDESPSSSESSQLPRDSASSALVAVCTLNEADNIVELVRAIRAAIPEADLLVVDDNSPDGTAQLVAEIGQHDRHVLLEVRRDQQGLGSAIRLAMTRAVDGGYTYFLNLDGDFSHDPRQLATLLETMRASDDDVDVVIGSRYVDGGAIEGWPLHRRLMSRMVNGFATACLRLPVSDCSGSMRCYRVAALERLGIGNLRVDGYAVLEEILISLARQGSRMVEVPITFTDRQKGSSKLTLREALRSSYQMVKMAIRPAAR
jgi:dolichol-phosphate mannosyltransferase